jgi:hypothetical protein
MAEYANFHEFRRYMNQADVVGLCDAITCHKNKEQLSKWLQSQMNRRVASDAASMHGMAFCSFEHTLQCPMSYLSDEVLKCAGVAIERIITRLIAQKDVDATSYGDAFTYQYENAYGLHSYDSDSIRVGNDEVLVSVNSPAPDDFIEGFKNCFAVRHKQHHSSLLSVVPKDCFAIGLAILAKSSKMIQIHVGVALKNPMNVRIITNEAKSSPFDKMMAVNTIIDKAGFHEQI